MHPSRHPYTHTLYTHTPHTRPHTHQHTHTVTHSSVHRAQYTHWCTHTHTHTPTPWHTHTLTLAHMGISMNPPWLPAGSAAESGEVGKPGGQQHRGHGQGQKRGVAALPSWDRKVAPEPHWQRQGRGQDTTPTGSPEGRGARKTGPCGGSPGGRAFPCVAFGGNWAKCLPGRSGGLGSPGGEPSRSLLLFVSSVGRAGGPTLDREAAGVMSADLGPLLTCLPPAGGAGGAPPLLHFLLC